MTRKEIPPLSVLLSRGDLIRPDELAAGMKVAQGTIYMWVEKGVIPFLRIEKVIRFDLKISGFGCNPRSARER